MIPSHPLRLGEAARESLSIFGRSLWRSVLLFAILFVPFLYLISNATGNLVREGLKIAEKSGAIDNDILEKFRVTVVYAMKHPDVIDEQTAPAGPALDSMQMLKQQIDSTLTAKNSTLIKTTPDQFISSYVGEMFGQLSTLVLSAFLLVLGGSLYFACVADLATRGFEERSMSLKRVLSNAVSRNMWRILLFGFLVICYLVVVNVVVEIGYMIGNGVGSFLNMIVFAVGLLLSIKLSVVVPAMVSEDIGPIQAINRSWQLTQFHYARLFGWYTVLLIMLFGAAMLLLIPLAIVGFAQLFSTFGELMGSPGLTVGMFANGIHQLFNAAIMLYSVPTFVVNTFFLVFATVSYYDLRTRLDGPLVYPDEPVPMVSH